MLFLNFPALAATTLSGRLDRPAQLRAAALAGTAAGYMQDRPYRPIDGCIPGGTCKPRFTHGEPLCLMCAVDDAAERHAITQNVAQTVELFSIATTVKQAVIDTVGANPDVMAEVSTREALILISMRLHTGDLDAMTAVEQQEVVMRLRCLRAINGAGFRGRLRSVADAVEADLERRGWAVGGHVTPAGQHAADTARRTSRV